MKVKTKKEPSRSTEKKIVLILDKRPGHGSTPGSTAVSVGSVNIVFVPKK